MSGASRPTILLADDDRGLTAAMALRFDDEGYRCVTAHSGEEALRRFTRDGPDLVICDLNMPGGDGAELAEGIRRISAAPIILISGCREDFRRRLRRIPDVSFLPKPFLASEAIDLVRAALLASHGSSGSDGHDRTPTQGPTP
jgi:two-component system KDP operon response regulator KdpE